MQSVIDFQDLFVSKPDKLAWKPTTPKNIYGSMSELFLNSITQKGGEKFATLKRSLSPRVQKSESDIPILFEIRLKEY